MSDDRRPIYLERGGEQVPPPPYRFENVRIHSFPLRADRERMQKEVVDRYLNRPRAGQPTYRVVGEHAMLMFVDCPHIASSQPPWSTYGFVPEIDAGYWILVAAGHDVGTRFHAESLAWFQPYLFVNSSMALVAGREVFGFAKEYGAIAMPADNAAGSYAIEAMVFPTYGPGVELAKRTVTRVSAEPTVPGPVTGKVWRDFKEALADLGHLLLGEDGMGGLLDLDLVVSSLHDLLTGESRMVYLKQFRDATDPSRACYQAVVSARTKLERFRGGGWLPGAYRVEVTDFASHPIADNLGLVGSVQAVNGLRMECDFLLEPAAEIWPVQG